MNKIGLMRAKVHLLGLARKSWPSIRASAPEPIRKMGLLEDDPFGEATYEHQPHEETKTTIVTISANAKCEAGRTTPLFLWALYDDDGRFMEELTNECQKRIGYAP